MDFLWKSLPYNCEVKLLLWWYCWKINPTTAGLGPKERLSSLAISLSSWRPQLQRLAALSSRRMVWTAWARWCSLRFRWCWTMSRPERGKSTHGCFHCGARSPQGSHPECEPLSAPTPKSRDFYSNLWSLLLDDRWLWYPKGLDVRFFPSVTWRPHRRRLLCLTDATPLTVWDLQTQPDLRRPLSLRGPGATNPWHFSEPQHLRRPVVLGRGAPTSWLSPNSSSLLKFGCSAGKANATRSSPSAPPGRPWLLSHAGPATPRHGVPGTPWPRNPGDHGRGGRSPWHCIPSWAVLQRCSSHPTISNL